MVKRVLITGGTGGLGSVIGDHLLKRGWYVHAPTRQELNLSWVPNDGPAHWHLPEVEALVVAHGHPIEARPFVDSSHLKFRDLLDTDVVGAFTVAQAVAARWIETDRPGHIVFFSSIRAQHPRPTQVMYATAKAAMEGMTRALAVALGPHRIQVNCVAPGAVMTPRTRANIDKGVVNYGELTTRTPMGELVTPEAVARTVRWLCECEGVTGQVVTVDGGWSVSG